MRYIPAILFAIIGAFFFLATFTGDNTDARALSSVMIFPAIICALLAILAFVVAKFL